MNVVREDISQAVLAGVKAILNGHGVPNLSIADNASVEDTVNWIVSSLPPGVAR